MNLKTERKIRINEFLIKARWFYILGVFFIGVASRISSNNTWYFDYSDMIVMLLAAAFLNFLSKIALKKAVERKQYLALDEIGGGQVVFEMMLFLIIFHYSGGIEGISYVFFFLPIVSSSLLFGLRGALWCAYFSAVAVIGLTFLEYYGVVKHLSPGGIPSKEYIYLSISLPKIFSVALFYIIIGAFAGFGAKLLYARERMLGEQAEKLSKEKELRLEELVKLDITTKKLIRRELELTTTNKVLDKNIEDLEYSKKSLEEAKRKAEEERNKTMAIISNFSDPIIAFDKEGKLHLFNTAAQELLNLTITGFEKTLITRDELSLNKLMPIMKCDMKVRKIETDPEDLLNEEATVLYKGKEITYKVKTVEIVGKSGEYLGIMKIFFNLTREKIIDKLKSDFISIAAHQLRTPLSAIKWTLHMILEGDAGPINEEQKDLLSKGFESNERMINLVNDLLNVSRIEEGRFGYKFEEGNLQEVINAVVENMEKFIAKKHLKFMLKKAEGLPAVVFDKSKMTLVIQNLVENAIKYTPENGTVSIVIGKMNRSALVVRVQDTGVGIPKQDMGKLFSKFFRASNVMRMETDGTGLGLFIVKNIVEEHGGRVIVKSEEGRGTEFAFTLPLKPKKAAIS